MAGRGGAPPEQFAQGAEAVRAAWREEGREGKPRLTALTYFGLGRTGAEDAGCDELTFFPTSTDPQQVDLLADAVGL